MAYILIVDDEPNLRDHVGMVLKARGYDVEALADGEQALGAYARRRPDVVVLDLVLPGMSGLDILKRLHQMNSEVLCIMITAHGSVPSAVEAMRAGAYDYLTKPFDNNDLVARIERALRMRQLSQRVIELEEDLSARSEFGSIAGRSQAIRQVLRRLAKVAHSNTSVLISGESGTGKGLAAISVHRGSARSEGPFVEVNCGAIAPSIAEAELFGHIKGAFTDAKTDHRGRFEQANGGTLFLDEVSELSPDLQVKLLRVIEDHHVHPLGSEQPVPIDVRVIAATNRDLSKDVESGRFRSDLFWRLNVFQVEMPALRDRLDDLVPLIERLLDISNAECRTDVTGVSPEVFARFRAYRWPGNVRELANVLRHAVVMAETSVVQVADLPDYFTTATDSEAPQNPRALFEQTVAETERRLLEATIARFQGNRTAAADALGMARKTLYNRLRKSKPPAKS